MMQAVPILNLNKNLLLAKNGEARDARNVIVTKDQKAVRNEDGFSHLYTANGTVVGTIDLPNGFVLFIDTPTTDKIVHIENDVVIKTILSNYFNFSINNPIKGTYTYNSDGDIVITFSEGSSSTNETRILNITKSSTVLTKSQVELLDLIPNVIYPTITTSILNQGSLLVGTYQIAIAYLVDKGIYTNYSILHKPIYLFGKLIDHNKIGTSINKSIVVNSANLDTRYAKYKLAILYKGEDSFEKVYETDDISISKVNYTLSNLDSLSSTSIENVIIPTVSYIKDEAHINFQNRLYRGAVKSIDYTGLDAVMNNIASNVHVGLSHIDPYTGFDTFYDTNVIKKHFKGGEHYLLYLGCFDYKGNFVNAYPIPWKQGDATDMVYADIDHTFKTHKIPYTANVNPILRPLYSLDLTLPSNIDSRLGVFANTITSFCYFYAEHNLYNSKVLGQGYVIRDTHVNDFNDNQTYRFQFNSHTKLRLYSFEHLFNKSIISNASIYNHKKLPNFQDAEYTNPDNTLGYYAKIYSESNSIPDTRTNIPISKIDYVPNDNVVSNNIAGDSFHRLTMNPADTDTLFGTSNLDWPTAVNEIVSQYFLSSPEFDFHSNQGSNNKAAICDIISNSDYFYDNIYKQKLVICSNIIPKTKSSSTSLEGDFFYENLTIRITTPHRSYKYGTDDVDAQSDLFVYKAVISIPLESRFNLRARYDGVNDYQKVFNIEASDDSKIQDLINIPYTNDNFINTLDGKGYSISANANGYDYNDYVEELDTKFYYPNRVVRSTVNTIESQSVAWRAFKADDYKDLFLNRGDIVSIECDENNIYIQQRYALVVASVRDKLSSSSEGDSYLGSSDVFDRDPAEVMFDKTGYIGCNSKFSTIITPFGYVVVDTSKKNIFLVKSTGITKLNNENVEDFFDTYLNPTFTNPYKSQGICMLYDDEIKSLFITHQNGNDSFTIHYNLVRKHWLSFHDYLPQMYITNRIYSYCIKDNNVYKRYANNKGLYFSNTPSKASISYIYNIQPDIYKLIKSISWNTNLTKGNTLVYDRTFDTLLLYSDTQCTGEVDINKIINWFDTESGVYKRDNWYFNNIKDIVIDDTKPFIDEYGNLITSNLNPNNDWFNIDEFIGKYLVIKFVYNNYFININSKEVSESESNDKVQLEVVLNSFDVNAIKSIR